MLIKKIKNNTAGNKIYNGQEIVPAAYYQIEQDEEKLWINDSVLIADITSGDAVVNDNISDLSISAGLRWLNSIDPACVQAECIDFELGNTAPHKEGRARYDSVEKALILYNSENEISQQLGQEFYVRVYNNTGVTILDGKPVYLLGTETGEDRPTIALAKADADLTSHVIGVTTHPIENGTYGFVTQKGLVNDLDTSAFASGDQLFVSEVTSGNYRNTPAPDGNRNVFIGYVIKSHATLGRILVTSAGSQSKPSASGTSYGNMSYTDPVTPDVMDLTLDVWQKITSFDTDGDSGVDYVSVDLVTNNRMTIGQYGGGKYLMNYQVSGEANGAGDLFVGIFKNGVVQEASESGYTVTNNNKFTMSGILEIDLVENDYVELYIKADSNTVDPDLRNINFTINRITGGSSGPQGTQGPSGTQGIQGDQGDTGLLANWLGTWVSQNYVVDDAVEYLGSSYINILNTVSSEVPTNATYWDLVAQKGDVGSSAPSSMPLLSLLRTTSFAIPVTPTNITLDSEDAENEPLELEHDDVNTARVYLRSSGYYLGIMSMSVTNSANTDRTLTLEVWRNNTSVLSSTTITMGKGSTEHLTRNLILPPLVANDFVTVRLGASQVGDLLLEVDTRLSIVKMTGAKGDTGIAGADGDITWEGNWVSQNYTTNQAVKYTDGNSYVCKLNTVSSEVPTNATYWDILAEKGDTGSGSLDTISIHPHNASYKSQVSSSYVTEAHYAFRGTTVMTPIKIFANIFASSPLTTGKVRIYDSTNSLVIAELTSISNNTMTVTDLGTLSNLSSGAANWEIQIAGDSSNSMNISSLSVEY